MEFKKIYGIFKKPKASYRNIAIIESNPKISKLLVAFFSLPQVSAIKIIYINLKFKFI